MSAGNFSDPDDHDDDPNYSSSPYEDKNNYYFRQSLKRKYLLNASIRLIKANHRYQHLYALLDQDDKFEFEELATLHQKNRRNNAFKHVTFRTIFYFLLTYSFIFVIDNLLSSWNLSFTKILLSQPYLLVVICSLQAIRLHFHPDSLFYYVWVEFLRIKNLDFRQYTDSQTRFLISFRKIPILSVIIDYIIETTDFGNSQASSSYLHN